MVLLTQRMKFGKQEKSYSISFLDTKLTFYKKLQSSQHLKCLSEIILRETFLQIGSHNYIHVHVNVHIYLYLHSGVETAYNTGHCPINLVNIW